MKVLLILVDGMRPDAVVQNKIAGKFLEESTFSLNAATVFPPVTLPCHMSLFHSVDPFYFWHSWTAWDINSAG